ncbi:hypothetical protein HDF16_003813 [Granulicella aggregans]|uniref:CGNR zinc finger domain-containing protein n=1 Tax=Granulicella aggregans TaxID=474949 RepID=A0A7W8E6B6_9BACT|nr:hypothetical protein [Granulicella aggregans]
MKLNSPENGANQCLGLITISEVRDFLMDSLNLPNPLDSPEQRGQLRRWLKKWQRLFTFHVEVGDGTQEESTISAEHLERFAPYLRTALRRIWHEADARQRDWYLYRLRDKHHHMIVRAENPYLLSITATDTVKRLREFERTSCSRGDDPSQRERFFESMAGADLFEDVPRVSPFEAAVYWLQANQKLMVFCEGPECAAPYFFRAEKGQTYCSNECANVARKAAKLKWWNENRKAKSRIGEAANGTR